MTRQVMRQHFRPAARLVVPTAAAERPSGIELLIQQADATLDLPAPLLEQRLLLGGVVRLPVRAGGRRHGDAPLRQPDASAAGPTPPPPSTDPVPWSPQATFRLIRSSILVLLPATRPERGQFYFAETGHYHFAATGRDGALSRTRACAIMHSRPSGNCSCGTPPGTNRSRGISSRARRASNSRNSRWNPDAHARGSTSRN